MGNILYLELKFFAAQIAQTFLNFENLRKHRISEDSCDIRPLLRIKNVGGKIKFE